ncbi:hypothetical protein BJX65DRAFT_297025 [Aspergillus insuetus]
MEDKLQTISRISFSNARLSASNMDQNAPLKDLRQQFHIPTKASVAGCTDPLTSAQPAIYLCGNQIGLQPRRVPLLIQEYLETWATQGMYGLVRTADSSSLPTWKVADRVAAELIAPIVGAKPHEVAVMGNLTTNLHLLLASFYRPQGKRTKILLERGAFSSDFYAVQSQLQWHGLDPAHHMVLVEPDCQEKLVLQAERILSLLDEGSETIALVLLSGVQYLTGQVLPMQRITSFASLRGITVGWDLAHAVGNVELCLHSWEADFAVWCSYKYMNAGPGAIGGIFVHERHGKVDRAKGMQGYRPRLAGWWGSEVTSRFRMENRFAPSSGAAGFQLSNPSMLDTMALIGSLEIFNQTSMAAIREASMMLTGYLEYLLSGINPRPFQVMTSSDPQQRGAQLSLRFSEEKCLNRVVAGLKEKGIVVAQTRDVMRVAPVPLYNTFTEVWDFVNALQMMLQSSAIMNVLLFGDQSSESFDVFCCSETFHPPEAHEFLAQVDAALRKEIALLSPLQQKNFPNQPLRADTISDWVVQGSADPVLRPVLTAIAQSLGALQHFNDLRTAGPAKQYLVGSCTGLLVAAAATVQCMSLSQWIPLAVHTVCIALRIGLHTAAVGALWTGANSSSQSWSSVVQGVVTQDMLDTFRESMMLPIPYQVYIAASTPNTTTISGPPYMLKRFLCSQAFEERGWATASIPVFSPYHAAHLHSGADLNWILRREDTRPFVKLKELAVTLPLISTYTGKPFVARDLDALLHLVVLEILNDVLRWDVVLDNLVPLLCAESAVAITVVGSAGLKNSLVSAIRATPGCEVSFHSTTPKKGGKSNPDPRVGPDSSKIAIIGVSGRFPGAKNIEELWDVLTQGLDLHREVPKDRFDVETHVDPSGKRKNTSSTPYGCFVDGLGLFDPSFFRMSPREAAVTDPMQRLILVTAYEALEMAGYVPNRTPSSMLDRVGTFYGQTLDDYREVNASQNVDTFYVTGNLRPFGPGRISYYHKFTGPSYVIDTACSSSLAAIHLACTSLRMMECGTAVAGGANIITGSAMYAGLSRGKFLSKTGGCKTFDEGADGYCRADGVATIVLKRLEDAEADSDPILGVILASATNHSSLAPSITQPHGETQEMLYQEVLHRARVQNSDVNYVEMHGTGTQIGDSTEMRSISNVFGDCHRKSPLYVGSLKPNVGHSEAAAGVTSVIKGLLMFQNNGIPPHIGIRDGLNPLFPDLDGQNIVIASRNEPFATHCRLILINNFGAAGGNTALLLEEPPAMQSREIPDQVAYPVERLLAFLTQNKHTSLANLSYTITARRQHYGLHDSLKGSSPSPTIETPALVFTFTGQGSMYSGVGQELFLLSRKFRADMIQFDTLAQAQGFPSFLPALEPSTELSSLAPVQTQLGQVCIQMALIRLYESWMVTPQAVVGHSLGEYAALYAAGVLTASDTILIAGRRAELMERHCTPPFTSIQEAIRDTAVELACVNGPRDIVATRLQTARIQTCLLSVPYACHSSQVDPVLEPFANFLVDVQFDPPRIPLLSPLLGIEIREAGVIDAQYLIRHLRETVEFVDAIRCSDLLGPHPAAIPTLKRGEGASQTGLDIGWEQYHRDTSPSALCMATLPSYSFDEKNYWIDYKNDWALTIGDDKPSPAHQAPRGPATSSVQFLVHETLDTKPAKASFESDLSEPSLYNAIAGHLIQGRGLCPSDLSRARSQWRLGKHLVASRIAHLQSTSYVHRLHRKMAYRLFGAVVQYSEEYHGLAEVLMDSEQYEAVARVSFQAKESAGDFLRNPFWLDNVAQLAGFVMNANEVVDTASLVYISNGWDSLQVICRLAQNQVYTVYVKMETGDRSGVSGDLYVLDADQHLVALVRGIRFQAVPRPLLKLLLEPLKAPLETKPQASRDSTISSLSSRSQSQQPATPTASGRESPSSGNVRRQNITSVVLDVLAEELGSDVRGLDQNITLAEMGVDSLMCLTVLGHLRESFFINLSSSLLHGSLTLREMIATLQLQEQDTPRGSRREPEKRLYSGPHREVAVGSNARHATSVLLQGDIRTVAHTLFLFPGGFGTSSTFASMPLISTRLAVYGLNSAFVTAPEDFTVTVAEMAALYVAEIQRRQPHGPYSFLGYSVGGIIAYEATRYLLQAGEPVERLYLVDSPCPLVIPPMPPSLISFLDSIDRFGGEQQQNVCDTPKPMGSLHVTQTLASLQKYMPNPLSPAASLKTTYYVARQGVKHGAGSGLADVSDKDRKVITWLLDNRTGLDQAGEGWGRLLGTERLKVVPIEGNHFNIMTPPYITEWVDELRRSYFGCHGV